MYILRFVLKLIWIVSACSLGIFPFADFGPADEDDAQDDADFKPDNGACVFVPALGIIVAALGYYAWLIVS